MCLELHGSSFNDVLDLLNSLESSIRFTLEIGGSFINFLDLFFLFLLLFLLPRIYSFLLPGPLPLLLPLPLILRLSLPPLLLISFFLTLLSIVNHPTLACLFMVIHFITFLINSPHSTQWFIASSLSLFLSLPLNLSAILLLTLLARTTSI